MRKMSNEAELWLQSFYPELFNDWREAYLKPSETISSGQLNSTSTECKICQIRPHTGLHYGVHTCEADKQFLKRTFHERQTYKLCNLHCPPRFRGWCQYCRLKSSLLTGINLKMIRIGDRTKKDPKSPTLKLQKTLDIKSEPSHDIETPIHYHTADHSTIGQTHPTTGDMITKEVHPPVPEIKCGAFPDLFSSSRCVAAAAGRSEPVDELVRAWLRPDLYSPAGVLEPQHKGGTCNLLTEPYQPFPIYQHQVLYWPQPHYPPTMTDFSYNYIHPQHTQPPQPTAVTPPQLTHPPLFTHPLPPMEPFERPRSPNQELPLDLSSSSSSSSSSSRPSSRASVEQYSDRWSPSFQSAEIGNSFNKLSVNSAVLQDALNMVEGSLSPGRFANISNLSEVLSN